MGYTQSTTVRFVTALESWLERLGAIGIRAAVFVGCCLLLYVCLVLAQNPATILTGGHDPFKQDPFFVLGGTAVGWFVIQGSGSLLLYEMLTGVETERSQFAVLMGFISLGFGGAVLRLLLPDAWTLLLAVAGM